MRGFLLNCTVETYGDVNTDYYNWNPLRSDESKINTTSYLMLSKPQSRTLPMVYTPQRLSNKTIDVYNTTGFTVSAKDRLTVKDPNYKFETDFEFTIPVPPEVLKHLPVGGYFINLTISQGPDDRESEMSVDDTYALSMTFDLSEIFDGVILLLSYRLRDSIRNTVIVQKLWGILKPRIPKLGFVKISLKQGWLDLCQGGRCLGFNMRSSVTLDVSGWRTVANAVPTEFGFEVVDQ